MSTSFPINETDSPELEFSIFCRHTQAVNHPNFRVAGKLAPDLMGAIAVADYSCMALMSLIQPPIMRALTTEAERKIEMVQLRHVSNREKIIFSRVLLVLIVLLLPDEASLLGMFCFGNLSRTCGVTERLSDAAQNTLINAVTICLGLVVGSRLAAKYFLNAETLGILVLELSLLVSVPRVAC